MYFGAWQARNYLAFHILGFNWVTGMSVIFKKEVVDKFGGLKSLGCYLAEDYFLGLKIQEEGYQVRIAPQPAWQNPAPGDLKAFQGRLRR